MTLSKYVGKMSKKSKLSCHTCAHISVKAGGRYGIMSISFTEISSIRQDANRELCFCRTDMYCGWTFALVIMN